MLAQTGGCWHRAHRKAEASAGQLPLLGADGFTNVEICWLLEVSPLQGSAWFLSSWPKGFLSLIREDWYGSAVNWLENKSFGRIWERGDRKNKEGICLICNFIDSLNVLIHILRLQLLRFDLCLIGLGIFRKFLWCIYTYIYIYVPWCIHGVIYILNWKELTCQSPKALQHWHFIWNFMCPIKPLQSTIFSSFAVSLLLSVSDHNMAGFFFWLSEMLRAQ